MNVSQLNHVALHVHDLDASVRFYREVLELAPIDRPAFDFPGAWFALGPGQELHLIAREPREGPYSVPRERHYALRVSEIEAAAEELRGKGVTFGGPKQRPDGAWQIFLRDPDGHVIELCQLV